MAFRFGLLGRYVALLLFPFHALIQRSRQPVEIRYALLVRYVRVLRRCRLRPVWDPSRHAPIWPVVRHVWYPRGCVGPGPIELLIFVTRER